ncbi:MAG: hypothetical protein AAB338_02505 [Patescibacteria group bacterium]
MPVSLVESSIYDPYDAYLNYIGDDQFKYKRFNDKIKNLPEKLQDFIFDTMLGDFIKGRISVPLGLSENQSQETAKIVMELIIADLYLGNIVNEVKNRLGTDDQKAKTIAGLVIELFTPVLNDLKKMHLEKFAGSVSKQEIESEPKLEPTTKSEAPAEDESIVDLRNIL